MQHICHNDAELYQQVFGTAMGYPVSVTVANLAMKYIEERAISSLPPSWERNSDIFTALPKNLALSFHQHL